MRSFFRRKRATIPPPIQAPAVPDPLGSFFQEAEKGFRQRESELAREAAHESAREAARRIRALYVVESATEEEWIQGGMIELRLKSAAPQAPAHDDEEGEVTSPGLRLAGTAP